MKIFTIISLLLAGCFSLFGQTMPDWVKERPVSSVYYIGIGRAQKTDKDYMQTAKDNALKDLASELKVQVSSSSLLHTLEGTGGNIDSRFEETVRVSVCESMEKFHMAGVWQNEKEYWVFYELSVIDYEEYVEKRRRDAISQGYDFWTKGSVALNAGELMTALEFWIRGLEIVQPVINEELSHEHNGFQIDVACELYGSVKNIFAGVALVADSSVIQARAYRPVDKPVGLSLSGKGVPMKNVSLKTVFVSGDGRLGQEIRTGADGRAALYIENVTSSLPRQQIRVEINTEAFRSLMNGVFGGLMKEVLASAPQVVIRVNVVQEDMRAFIRVAKGADVAVVRAVKDLLTRNRFMLVDRPELADVEITVSAESRKGEKQRAGVSAVVAWYASVTVTITKREGAVVLLEYVPAEVKVLQAESVSEATASRAAVGELTRRINRELPERLRDTYR